MQLSLLRISVEWSKIYQQLTASLIIIQKVGQSVMLKAIENPPQQFDVAKTLQYICKKSPSLGSKPEIDFILLEREIGVLKTIQLKTIEQIVQFVDIHLDDFVGINDQMNSISDKIDKTEVILQLLNSKLQDHRTSYYGIEGKIQIAIDKYQQGLLQSKIIKLATEETHFLIKFNKQIELVMDKNVQNLTFTQKHMITRFCYKYEELKGILSHHMVEEAGSQFADIKQLLVSLENQLQLYLCEQLKRVVSHNSIEHSHIRLPSQFQIWFTYLNKKQFFYQIVEQHLISRELAPSQKQLLSNKVNILSGKNENLIQAFFKNIFTFVSQLPEDYPRERIYKLIGGFLQKKELNFLYTYMMPVFPIAYGCYMRSIEQYLSGRNKALKQQLKRSHNWNVRRWADFRAKSILDRSQKDNDLVKWIDIIFKSNCMVQGVKTNMVRLCLQIVNRHCQKNKMEELTSDNLNKAIENIRKVPELVSNYIADSYRQPGQASFSQQIGFKLASIVEKELKASLRKRGTERVSTLIKTCSNSLQNVKTFIMRVLGKKANQQIGIQNSQCFINRSEVLFKPLQGYIRSNPELTAESIDYMCSLVSEELQTYYAISYTGEIDEYCKTNVTADQHQKISRFMTIEKEYLFHTGKILDQEAN